MSNVVTFEMKNNGIFIKYGLLSEGGCEDVNVIIFMEKHSLLE